MTNFVEPKFPSLSMGPSAYNRIEMTPSNRQQLRTALANAQKGAGPLAKWLRASNARLKAGLIPASFAFTDTVLGREVRSLVLADAVQRAKRKVSAAKAKKTRAAKAAKFVALPPEVVAPEGEPEVVNITSTIAADYGLGDTVGTTASRVGGFTIAKTPAEPVHIATFNETPTQSRSEQARKYPQYYKEVPSHVPRDEVDTYVVNMMFPLVDDTGILLHARKKLLIPGVRSGGKTHVKDVTEARDALNRWLALQA